MTAHPGSVSTGQAAGESDDDSQPTRVLVIDDNQDAADTVGMLLSRQGYVVRVGYDPFTVIDLVHDFCPDVVILDIGMPGKSGLEVAQELRDTLAKQPALVALTSYGTSADRQRGFDAGFDRYCVKPLRSSELRAVIESCPVR
jgi:DNA-binding response OmpR family regulator